VTTALVAYNFAVVVQEFQRGVAARRKSKEESVFGALFRLVAKSRRRYGGYIVHVGISVMFLGFAGKSWETKKEITMSPEDTTTLGEYRVVYKGPRMEVDHEKRMVFADIDVYRGNDAPERIAPAQFIYKDAGQQMSTESAMFHTIENDLYVSVGTINPQSKQASFRIYINPLVNFVWLGVMILILGAMVSMWPELSFQEAGAFAYVRALGSVATMVMLSIVLAFAPSMAHAQQHEMRREGIVEQSEEERSLFKQLLCNCGTCPKEALETCTCGWAHNAREQVRADLAAGMTPEQILNKYKEQHGAGCVIVQATSGWNRAMWAVPLGLGAGGFGLIWYLVRRWRGPPNGGAGGATPKKKDQLPRDRYDDQLDKELRDLE
jgi:cytochrome c-type biogenesis protein CcmF